MNKQVRPPKIDDTQKKSVDELLRGFSSGISYRALEPRIAFDAAAVATAAATSESTNTQSSDAGSKPAGDAAPHAVSDGDSHDGDTGGAHTHDAQHDQSSDAFADAIMATDAPQQDAPVTIVFIDKAVENIDQIISSTDPSWEIVMIDQDRGGLDQMASYLSGRTDVGSIHVVSHGEAGTLYLGNDALTNANLADYQAQLTAIGQALNDNGDILLYGCEIGAGTGGMDFVRAFSNYTGADIAASIDKTGGDEAGGDWVLEATSGAIEARALENPLYAGILAKTNTGAWAANGATAANDWQNTTDGITTTVTFTNGGNATWTGTASDTLNTTSGGISATTFDNGAAGSPSVMSTFTTDNTNDVGTITITFSTAVTNPVIHIDRLGGVSGTANSAVLTLTSGGTLTRVSGVNHFLVDTGAGTITRQVGVNTNGSESNTNSSNGTAAGSVRVNGTYTTITFNVRMNTAASAGIGDAFELAFAIDAPPTAVNDTFTTLHDTPTTINVRANDTDPRGDTLTVTKVNGTAITAGGAGVAVTGGTVTLVSGNLVFTPTANYVGSPSFTYTIADANGGESTATVTGTVTNTAPVVDLDGSAAGTGFSTTFTENGAAVSIADTDAVMTDVDDANLESASVTLTNQQTGDRLLVNGSTAASGTIGTIAWTRTNTVVTFTGTATKAQYAAAIQLIQFENTTDTPATTARIINTIVNDGNANSNTAVTTIAINRAPDPTDDAFSGNEDTAISANVLTNDTDVGDGPGAPPLSIVTGPANGVLTSFNTTTGAFIYTPNANYNGTDTFTYRYTDVDGDSKVATVTLTIIPVNDAPVNTLPASLGPVAEDGTLSITGVSVTDVDSGTLTTTLTIGNGALNVGTGGGVTITGNGTGTVTLAGTAAQINAALATLSFTPTADYNGTATFQISTTDGALTDVDSRTITITPVADIVNDVVVTNEDTVVSFNVISGLNETSGADNFEGTPVVTAINGAAYTAGTPISIVGGQITVQPNGVVTFNPTANYNGATSFTYTVTSGGVTETATVNITVNPVNDAPVGVNDTGTAAEAGGVNNGTAGSNATGNVLTNDTDVDTPAANLTVSAVRLGGTEGSGTAGTVGTALAGTYGTLTLNANGSYTYVVNNNNAAVQALAVGQTLTESFNYTVSDGSLSDIAVLTITINGANDAPVATNDSGTIAEDTTLAVPAASGLLSNDTDVDGGALSVTQFSVAGVAGTFTAGNTATIPSVGTLRINADGSYVFTPAANYNGAVPVATYTVSDGAGGTATATLSIAVTPVNDAPVATNDTGTIAEDTTLTVNAASGLLANDSDVDGNTLSVTQFSVAGVAGTFTAGNTATIPSVGTLRINADGSYVFTPAANYNGAVPVATYTVSDGAGGTATATLSIAVTPVNDAPVATNDTGTIAEDTTLTVNAASGLLANDSDVDGNTLSVTQFSVAGVAGTFTAGNTATIPSVGTLRINADGSYVFTPAANYNGSVPVATYTVSDGAGGTATATLSIAVTPVNDAPVATNDTGTIAEDTTLTVNAASGLLANDSDVDGNTLSVTQFSVAGVAGTFTAGSTATIPSVGTLRINADGSYVFTPAANYNGAVPVATYTVSDGAGGTATATLSIAVTPVNDAPVNTVPGPRTAAEDTATAIAGVSVTDVDGGSLTTTVSVTNGTLTVTLGGGATIAGNGTGTITLTGTAATINAALAGLSFTGAADYNGPATLTVQTTDGALTDTDTVAITVTPVADITNDTISATEDTASTFNVLTGTNGATADNFEAAPAVTSVTQPANGTVTFAANGSITYTPSANFNGTDTFTYTVTSGGVTETATVTVNVAAVNDAPVNSVPGAQSSAEDTNLIFSAANGNAITVVDVDSSVTTTLTVVNGTLTLGSIAGVTVTGNGSGTVTVSGTPAAITTALNGLRFAPTADWNGSTTLNVSTSDGVAPAVASTVAITVTPVADIVANSVTTAEDTAATFNVLANDNFENPGATVTSVTQPANGTVTIGSGGNVTYTPAANYNGSDSFTYTVTSGGVTETTTVTITVTPVNDAPVADDETNATPENTTLTVPASAGVLVGDTDLDGDTLTVSQFTVAGVAGTFTAGSTATIAGVGTLRINADGSYVFTPAANYNGAVPVATYTVSDGNGGTDTGTLTLTVTPVNDAPIAVDDTGTATEDSTLTVNAASGLLSNDTDVDGNTLSITQFTVSGVAGTFTAGNPASIPGVGTLTINANGSYTFVPAANYNGAVPVATYTVSDGNGGTDTGTLTIAVTPVNDAPVNTVPGPRTAAEDTATAITGVSVSDVDGGSLTTTLSVTNGRLNVTTGGGATITGNGTGSVTLSGTAAQINAALAGLSFTGNADYNGPATLTVQTTDGALTDTDTVAITVTPVADITNDTVSGSEDSTISFNVLTGTNGATADNFEGTPSVTAFTQPANGTVTVAANGAVVYTPNANFNGTDTFTYTVTSGGVTETATVTINVAPVNDAPTQTLPPAQNGTEDTNVVFSGANGNQIILGDVDSGAVLTTTVSVPAGQLTAIVTPGVTITGNGTGSVILTGAPAAVTAALNGLTYRPVADANGTVVMSVSTSDGVAAPVNGSVSIAIAPVADIQNDTASVNEDNSATISVLANDSFENAGRTVTSATNGANGTVVINGNGTVTYTPNSNFNGTDTFTYTVTSGGVTETATVTVTVNPVNDAATQTTPPSQTTAEDTALVFSATNGNAVTVADIDGDTLTTTVSVTNGRVNLGSVAGVTVSGNGTGTVTITGSTAAINAALNGMAYTPTADYNGAAAMTVSTSDGATTASNTVAITVSPVADIVADTVTTPEDQAVVFNVLTNDNFENAGRTVTSVTNGANGTVTIGTGGQVTYTPNANFNGTDTFTYTVTSGGVTETATVTVTVTPVNDAVVTAVPGGQTTSEDTAVVFSAANGNAITVVDIDGDTISMTVSATNGRLTLGGTAGVTVSGNGTGTVTLFGSPAAINAALNGLGFAPTADYNGSAVISVTASDGPTTSSRTIAVTITPVADIVADSISTDEDTPVTFNALTNDTFENPGRTVTSVTQGSSGSVTFAANGTITYTPSLDYIGTDTFTYTVTSNGTTETTTVTVTIGGVNDVPTTTGLPDRSAQDAGVVSINVSGAFSDEDGDALTYSATGLPAGLTINPTTGVISGTIDKAASQTSPYSVTITANDGSPGGTVSTSFTWTISNPAPTARNDAVTVAEDAPPTNINVLANDTDPDGDTLSVTTATAANGTVSILPNGTISYRPNANFNGTDTISYQISDGNGGFSTATVTVTVTPVNDAPVADDETNSTPEDTTLTVPASAGVLVGDTDVDGNTLSVTQFTVAGVTGTFTAGSTATIAGVGTLRINADGSYVFTPAANYNGAVPVATYTVSDGAGGTDTGTLTLTVTPVNDAPVANDDTRTTMEDTTLTVAAATGLLANDTDVDGNTLTITQFTVAGVTGTFTAGSTATISGVGTLRINSDGSYVFTPAANYNGSVPVATYTVSDGNGGADTATLRLTVTPVNDAPVADDETNSTPEDTTLTVPASAGVLVGDTDVDGNTLSVTQFTIAGVTGTFTAGSTATIAGVGTLRINADGSYVFTPAANYNGAVPVATYTVSDGNGGTDTGTLTLTVTPVNDAPVVSPIADRSNADSQTVSVNVGSNFSDVDTGDTRTYTATGLPAGLSINATTGVISGTINRAASQGGTGGAYSVTVTATDAAGASVSDTFVWTITNPAPTAVADTRTTSEGATLTVAAASGVLSNDTDPDGDPLSVSAINGVPANVGQPVAGSAGGIFTINANGSYTFQPNGQFEDLGVGETRQTTVNYTVSDGNGGTSTATVTITVTGTNDAPTATAIPPAAGVDGAAFTLNPSASFSDVDGDTLTYSATGLPAGLTINATTGVISGTINRAASQGGAGGVYTVTITANDGNGGSTPATLTLTVTNPAPNAVNDSRSVTEDTIATGNVLTNDVDPDGDTLAVTGFTVAGISGTFNAGDTANIPGVGTLTINANGSYTFTPAPDYIGAVPQVTYAITDGNGGTDTATLDLGPVTSGNDAPASTPLPGRSSADGSTVTINVSGNFSDGDGDALTFSATGLPPGLSINPTTGVISGTIDHLASANGPYNVTVRATDPSGASTQQTFAWAVSNPAPTGTAIGNATGVDGTAVSLSAGAGFSDPDGDTLTFSASGLPTGLSINPATGVISGTLDRGASVGGPASNGVYTIAVTATDSQGALVTRTFTYTVSNPAPIAGNDTFTGTEDTPLTRSVTANDSDPDGDALTYSVVSGPANGTLVFNANGTFTYTPAANYNGPDTFTYRVTDANGASATAVVNLTVTPVNDAPVASNVSVTTPEDQAFSGTLTATDVDSPSLTFTKATNPSHGTVVVNPNGTYVYTPAANYNGPDSFTYTVSDGAGGTVTRTVAINVTPVNDAPVADDETGTTPEDTPLSVPASSGLLIGDTDVDGDTLAVTQFTVAGVTGTFTAGSTATISGVGTLRINADGSYVFTPAANYNGTVPVATYTVSDGNGGTDTATLRLTVTPVNDAPVASNVSVTTPEDQAFSGTLTATDVDSPSLTFTKATNPSHGTVVVNPNGTYVYTPAANYNGPDSFTYTVSDGAGGTVTRTVAINVTPVNDAPVAVNDAFSGNEDTVITGDVTPGTVGQDSDVDGDTITVVDGDGNASNGLSPVSGPANGTLVLNADGTFSYRPNANFNGTDSFRYRISDGNGGFAEATVVLTVNPVNDAPSAANGNATTPEDTTYNGTLPPASDVDGDTVTYSKASDPAHGTVVVNADGTYVYTPSANYNGTDTFNYSINDGNGGVATYTVTVVVTPVDDAPVVLTINAPPSKDADVITFDVSKFVTDVDGDPLRYTATGLPPGLTINPVTGVVTGTLPKDASQGGPYNVTLTVDNGNGGVVTTTFAWPVENPAPIAVDDRATVDSGKDVTVNVLANDRDPDGDALTVTRAQATNGTVDVLPDGSIRYVPRDGFVGQDRITYVISDGNGGTAIASVTITVRDDGYHEIPPQFGFNGPGEPDPFDAEPVLKSIPPSISADGAVVDAVFDIGLLRSVAGQLGANGAVLAAANGLRSLDGVASITDNGIVVETVRVERAREILLNAGFDRSFQEYRIEGLPGFSLRNNVPGNLGGLSTREQIIIESLVRQDTLIVQLSNTIESGAKRIVDYRITMADGSPLPEWLNHAAKDLLIGRRDAGVEQLDLKVEAVYSDNTVIVEHVRIDAATGEIQPLKMADAGQPAPRLFGDQFHAPSQLTPDEIQGLGKAIGR